MRPFSRTRARCSAICESSRSAAAIQTLSRSELLLDTERVALQALFDMIRRFKVGYDVELHKRTLECSLFSLIGPRSRAVAACAGRVQQESLTSRTSTRIAWRSSARTHRCA